MNTSKLLRTAALRMGLPLLIAGGTPPDAALFLDGRLRVVGEPIEGARVIVYRDDKPTLVLTDDIEHFELRLELQRTYLLSFEREGCITKQLLFDTRVPGAELENAPFIFPFKVTLERLDEGSTLRYAGPVGFIRYFEDLGDFDYDRNYAMLRDPEAVDEVPAAVSPMSPDPIDPMTKENEPAGQPVLEAGAAALDIDKGHPEAMPSRPAIERPARRMVEPFIDPTMALGDLAAEVSIATSPTRSRRMVESFVDPTLDLGLIVDSENRTEIPPSAFVSRRAIRKMEATRSGSIVPRARRPYIAPPPPVIHPEGRSEELLEEKLRVTRIVRLTANGHTTEYRRVSHRYGPVYYFKNGISCSGGSYEAGIAGH